MNKWIYRIAILVMFVAIAGAAIYWIMLQTNPKTMSGPWIDPDYPTGTGWLLYPNGGNGSGTEAVSGMVTIQWNTSKTPGLGPEDTITIGWSHDVRGGASIFGLGSWPYPLDKFIHETWEGCYCTEYGLITDSAPNTGEYVWNATETLMSVAREHNQTQEYPYYIRIEGGKYMDSSNTFFNITG